MRLLYFFSTYFLLLTAFVQGQTSFKVYLDEDEIETNTPSEAVYFRTGETTPGGKVHGLVQVFTLKGVLVKTIDYYYGKMDGAMTDYHPNGKIAAKTNYTEDRKSGKYQAWHPNGKLKEEGEWVQGPEFFPFYSIESFWDSTGTQTVTNGEGSLIAYTDKNTVLYKEEYKAGKLVKGISYDENEKEWVYETQREKLAEFPDRIPKLGEYLQSSLKYPSKARNKHVTGTVSVDFVIGRDGVLRNLKSSGPILGYGLEEEAMRVIAAMPRWNPGLRLGKPVAIHYVLPIRFVLR